MTIDDTINGEISNKTNTDKFEKSELDLDTSTQKINRMYNAPVQERVKDEDDFRIITQKMECLERKTRKEIDRKEIEQVVETPLEFYHIEDFVSFCDIEKYPGLRIEALDGFSENPSDWLVTDGKERFFKIKNIDLIRDLKNYEDSSKAPYKFVLENYLEHKKKAKEIKTERVVKSNPLMDYGLSVLNSFGSYSDNKQLKKNIACGLGILAVSVGIGGFGGCLFFGSRSSTGFDTDFYSSNMVENRLRGMSSSLEQVSEIYSGDPLTAKLNVQEVLWFDKQVDRSKLSPEQRAELNDLVNKAESYQRQYNFK